MGTFEGNLQSVYVEWADVSMLLSWLQAQEAQSNHQKGDQSGLICSDNNKDSSDNLGTKAQSSSIRLGTQTAWFHFMFFSAAVPDCEELLETVRQFPWGFYPSVIPPENIEMTARTQLRDCQRELLIKQISILLYALRQETQKECIS